MGIGNISRICSLNHICPSPYPPPPALTPPTHLHTHSPVHPKSFTYHFFLLLFKLRSPPRPTPHRPPAPIPTRSFSFPFLYFPNSIPLIWSFLYHQNRRSSPFLPLPHSPLQVSLQHRRTARATNKPGLSDSNQRIEWPSEYSGVFQVQPWWRQTAHAEKTSSSDYSLAEGGKRCCDVSISRDPNQ